MQKKEKYVAYVGAYTMETAVGLHIYDVDPDTGVFTEKGVEPVSNASYVVLSSDGKFLYSIEDEGVCAFAVAPDGSLTKLNQHGIDGMRGDYLDVDSKNRYLFVGGYHDGKVTMLRLNPDGSIGDITCGIFHQTGVLGQGERHLDHAKVTCVKLTPDEKFLCAVDFGLNQIKVYRIDYKNGKLELDDIVRPELDAGARLLEFSKDGKFAYVLTSYANAIEVYRYSVKNDSAVFDQIQIAKAIPEKADENSALTNFSFSDDDSFLFVSVDAMNGVSWLKRNAKDGTLTLSGAMQTSGDFPKSLAPLPGGKYVAVLNHDTNEIRTFRVNYDENFILMQNAPVKIQKPNCIQILRLS